MFHNAPSRICALNLLLFHFEGYKHAARPNKPECKRSHSGPYISIRQMGHQSNFMAWRSFQTLAEYQQQNLLHKIRPCTPVYIPCQLDGSCPSMKYLASTLSPPKISKNTSIEGKPEHLEGREILVHVIPIIL